MKDVKLYCFPQDVNIKIKFPNTKKFVDYVTTKETVFWDGQIRPELSDEKTLCVSVRYHLGLIPREHIKDWR